MLTEETFFKAEEQLYLSRTGRVRSVHLVQSVFSAYCIDGLLLTEMECVYCAVRNGSLYTIQVNFRLLRAICE